MVGASSPRRVAILGSTGSVGTSALDVAAALPDRVQVIGLAAHARWERLAEQCHRVRPRVAILTDPIAFEQADRAAFPAETVLRCGEDATCELAAAADVDIVLAAVVGAAGLTGTWA